MRAFACLVLRRVPPCVVADSPPRLPHNASLVCPPAQVWDNNLGDQLQLGLHHHGWCQRSRRKHDERGGHQPRPDLHCRLWSLVPLLPGAGRCAQAMHVGAHHHFSSYLHVTMPTLVCRRPSPWTRTRIRSSLAIFASARACPRGWAGHDNG